MTSCEAAAYGGASSSTVFPPLIRAGDLPKSAQTLPSGVASTMHDKYDYHEFGRFPETMEADQDNTYFLATTVQLQEGLEVSTSDRDAAQAVAAGLRDAKAPNTRRAHASAVACLALVY